jgi:hypothetical protein
MGNWRGPPFLWTWQTGATQQLSSRRDFHSPSGWRSLGRGRLFLGLNGVVLIRFPLCRKPFAVFTFVAPVLGTSKQNLCPLQSEANCGASKSILDTAYPSRGPDKTERADH